MSGKKKNPTVEAPIETEDSWKDVRWQRTPVFDEKTGEQRHSGIGYPPGSAFAAEYPDPVPANVPLGPPQRDPLADELKSILYNERLLRQAEEEGFDTPDEAEDFEVEDDMFPIDPKTPYEAVFDPPPVAPNAAGGGGNGSKLASETVKGEEPRAERPYSPATVSQKAFEDLSVEQLTELLERKRSVGVSKPSDSSGRTSAGGASVDPRRKGPPVEER